MGIVKATASTNFEALNILFPALIIHAVACLIFFLLVKQNEKRINKALGEK